MATMKAGLMEKRWTVRVVERRAVLMSWRVVASLGKTMECEKDECFAVWTVALTAVVDKRVEMVDGKTVASKVAHWAGPRDVLNTDELIDLSEM